MAWETFAWVNRWSVAMSLLLIGAIPLHGAATTQPTTRPVPFEISFATVEQGKAAIVDETAEPYFKLLQPLEMAAKTGSPVPGENLAEQQAACRKRYQDAVLDFTPLEKDALNWYVSKLAAYTYPHFPLFAATPWKFIKLFREITGPQAIEGGNPFTRGQHICLSSRDTADIVKEMQNSIRGGADWTAMGAYGRVLLHEQMHVIQRGHRELFAKFYTETWGFTHAAVAPTDPWLVEHQMLDPDGVDQRWVYSLKVGAGTRWIWPAAILGNVASAGGPAFTDMQMVAVELSPGPNNSFDARLSANAVPLTTPLLNVLPYAAKFTPSREIFHPDEASADLFAHVTLIVDVLPGMAPPVAASALSKARDEFKSRHDEFMKLLGEAK